MIPIKWRIFYSQRREKAYKKLMKRKRIYRKVARSVKRRNRAERRFKCYGIVAILLSTFFLCALVGNIVKKGYTAFTQTTIAIPITYDAEALEAGDYQQLVLSGLKRLFPEATDRMSIRALNALISSGASYTLQDRIRMYPALKNTEETLWLIAASPVDMLVKHPSLKEGNKPIPQLTPLQVEWIETLQEKEMVRQQFNLDFFSRGDSRNPEFAGILGAVAGSFFVIISCMLVALPLGVLTAIYLEEFAPKNRLSEWIEVNINNLAAVPSIVFGLLGLTLYIQWIGIPRSAALAGGLTLALMALPVMVIATRTSIRAVPPSIREGAIALGASKLQTITHHVLPLAMPGIMTGTILSIARVLGETAPLLMIGMVAFVVDIPTGFLKASTALPVQVYLWSDSAEPGFIEKTSAAILILLCFLGIANTVAIILRKKFEVKW